MRVGVLGGTFDPIHVGHLVAAEEARCILELDVVLFVPAAQPPHKGGVEISAAAQRVEMVRLAIAANPFFGLSLVDVERSGKSYSVDTLARLREQYGPGVALYFIMGMDSLVDLPTWKDPGRLISLCRVAVVNRPPYHGVDLESLSKDIPGIAERIDVVRMPGIGVSASDLRERVAKGLPIRYQVPERVEAYIRSEGLYRQGGAETPAG